MVSLYFEVSSLEFRVAITGHILNTPKVLYMKSAVFRIFTFLCSTFVNVYLVSVSILRYCLHHLYYIPEVFEA